MKNQYFNIYKKKEQEKILQEFIHSNKNLAVQGSAEWLLDRKFTIGGSEMSIITGDNRFSSIECLISQKVGISNFKGNIATRWGSLFEDLTELIFNKLFMEERKIYSTGSIQSKEIKNHKFSPDGLAVVKYEYLGEKSKKVVNYLITLLEFKSPLNTIPDKTIPSYYMPQIKSGMCAIDITNISIFVNNMFRKCSIKQLGNNKSYDAKFHNSDARKKAFIDNPLCYGVILFYIKGENIHKFQEMYNNYIDEVDNTTDILEHDEEDNRTSAQSNGIGKMGGTNETNKEFGVSEDSESDVSDVEEEEEDDVEEQSDVGKEHENILETLNGVINGDTKLIDLGDLIHNRFDEFLQLLKKDAGEKFIEIKYITPTFIIENMRNNTDFLIPDELEYIFEDGYLEQHNLNKNINYEKLIDRFITKYKAENKNPIGVLPWKLFKSSNIITYKDAGFLNLYKHKIDEVTKSIEYILEDNNDMEKIIDNFKNMFPNSDMIREYHFLNSGVDKNELKDLLP